MTLGRRTSAVWSAAMLGAALAGCAGANRPIAVVQAPRSTAAPAPIVTTANDGLEVHWWIADDTDGAVGHALSIYADPALPDAEHIRARWNANGLRMVQVPQEQFAGLQSRLPAVRAQRKLWVGWVTSWTEIVRGRRAGGASPLIIDGQRSPMPFGVLRLIARCWPAPAEPQAADQWGGPAMVRLELACQLQVEENADVRDVFAQPRIAAVQDEGPVFRQLTLETLLDPQFVYVITSEAPNVVWSSRGASMTQTLSPQAPVNSGAGDDASAGEPEASFEVEVRAALPFDSIGPPVSSPLTVGQAMLSASHSETGWRDIRIIVVLIPRALERFQLLP